MGSREGRCFAIALGVLLLLQMANGALQTHDNSKCTAGQRDWCPPVIRCWTGLDEIPCTDTNAYATLSTALSDEPPRELKPGEPIHLGWAVDFKKTSEAAGAAYEHPWISHTNIHAAPSHLGVLSPPGKDPMRKDSVSFTGGPGTYGGDLEDMPEGEWLIMVHVRVQEINQTASRKYDMTVDIVRKVGDPDQAKSELEEADAADKIVPMETFCPVFGSLVFKKCDSVKDMWLAVMISMSAVAFFAWFFTNFHMQECTDGSYSIYFESTPLKIVTCLLLCVSLTSIMVTNMSYLDQWLATNRVPNQVPSTRRNDGTLVFPNILICPFQETGKLTVMSSVHYPNLYGLQSHAIKSMTNHSLKIIDNDGTNIKRDCWKFDMKKHHADINTSVTSVYATLMIKSVIKDVVRDDTGGDGDAMAIFYKNDADLTDANLLTSNMILLGQSKATYATLRRNEKVARDGNTDENYDFTVNTIDNPYPRDFDAELCRGSCTREAVVVINWKTLDTAVVTEEVTLTITTVMALMVGIVSGFRMATDIIRMNLRHFFGKYFDKKFQTYLVGAKPVAEDISDMKNLSGGPEGIVRTTSEGSHTTKSRNLGFRDMVGAMRINRTDSLGKISASADVEAGGHMEEGVAVDDGSEIKTSKNS